MYRRVVIGCDDFGDDVVVAKMMKMMIMLIVGMMMVMFDYGDFDCAVDDADDNDSVVMTIMTLR
jgi:hypothetical protein